MVTCSVTSEPQRLSTIDGTQAESPEDRPFCYAYEGLGSRSSSLDELSLSSLEDGLSFLNNLGPSFNKLGQICQQNLEEKNSGGKYTAGL